MVRDQKLVRIAIGGGDRALSDSKTAINIWVSPQEQSFLKRVEKLLFKTSKGGQSESYSPTLHVMEFEGAEQ